MGMEGTHQRLVSIENGASPVPPTQCLWPHGNLQGTVCARKRNMLSAHSWPSFSISSTLFFRYVSDYFGKKLRAHLLLSHLPLDFSYYNLNWERVVGEVVISSVRLLFVCHRRGEACTHSLWYGNIATLICKSSFNQWNGDSRRQQPWVNGFFSKVKHSFWHSISFITGWCLFLPLITIQIHWEHHKDVVRKTILINN